MSNVIEVNRRKKESTTREMTATDKERDNKYDRAFYFIMLNFDLEESVWQNKSLLAIPAIAQSLVSISSKKVVDNIVEGFRSDCISSEEEEILEQLEKYKDTTSKLSMVLKHTLINFRELALFKDIDHAIVSLEGFYSALKIGFKNVNEFTIDQMIENIEENVFSKKLDSV